MRGSSEMITATLRNHSCGEGRRGGEGGGGGGKRRERGERADGMEDCDRQWRFWCDAAAKVQTLLWNRLQGRFFTVCARSCEPTMPPPCPLPISIPPLHSPPSRKGIFLQSRMLTRYIRFNSLQPHRSYFAYILDRRG